MTDSGPGIPAGDLPHIFDRFYRVDEARARADGGAGLGLSIANWIARAHGGELSAQSEAGQGATFTLSLPLLAESADHRLKAQTTPMRRINPWASHLSFQLPRGAWPWPS